MVNRTALVWKYFFKQKWEEICDHFEVYWPIYCMVMVVVGLFLQLFWISPYANDNDWDYSRTGVPTCKTAAIVGLFMIGVWVLLLIISIVAVIFGWLNDNWELATKRADAEIKKIKKGEKK